MNRFRRPFLRSLWLILPALLLTLIGCGSPEGTGQLPQQASSQAPIIDWMFYFIFWLNVFYFAHIMAMMGYFMWRYRRRPGVEPEESPHHSTPLEIAWSIPPIILVMFMFWWGWTGYLDLVTPPDDAYKIEVEASQWKWEFTYPNGAKSDELHIPPGENIEMVMTSTDVLHSFYVPKFRIKQDVVPGRVTNVWFKATRFSTNTELDQNKNQYMRTRDSDFKLFCAEYCGTKHSMMWAPVIVHKTRADYEAWLKEAGKPTPKKLYNLNCSACHSLDGTASVGPTFKGLWGSTAKVYDPATKQEKDVKVDAAYLKESILKPGALLSRRGGKAYKNEMEAQGFADKLSPEQVDMLIEFLKDPQKHMAGK